MLQPFNRALDTLLMLAHILLKEYPSGIPFMIAGVTGGIFAACTSHPFDTVKTKMQAYMYSKPVYATFLSSLKAVYQEFGVSGFYKGVTPRLFRIIGKINVNFSVPSPRNRRVTLVFLLWGVSLGLL